MCQKIKTLLNWQMAFTMLGFLKTQYLYIILAFQVTVFRIQLWVEKAM